jgi:hypothetical protein
MRVAALVVALPGVSCGDIVGDDGEGERHRQREVFIITVRSPEYNPIYWVMIGPPVTPFEGVESPGHMSKKAF